jgi:hypothetical protein
MTRNEARGAIKHRAASRYSNSVILLLLKLVDLTFRKNKDSAETLIETTIASLLRAAAIEVRQLKRILDQLITDGVLTNVERGGGHLSCRLNLASIVDLPVYGDTAKVDRKAANAERSKAARERRQELREISQTVTASSAAVSADSRDFIVKTELLKDVKDAEIRRSMMNWDIPRIRRAKDNATRMTVGEA